MLFKRLIMAKQKSKEHFVCPQAVGPGLHSAASNMSGCRYVSDCRCRGRKFDPCGVPYLWRLIMKLFQ